MRMGVKISGVNQVKASMRRAAALPRGTALDADLREGLEPMREAINARAPRAMLKGTAQSALLRPFSPTRRMWQIAFREPGRRIAHLIELGTAPHSLAKGASRRKGLLQDVPPHHPGDPPHPFMRPAFEAGQEEVVRTFGAAVWRRILSVFGSI